MISERKSKNKSDPPQCKTERRFVFCCSRRRAYVRQRPPSRLLLLISLAFAVLANNTPDWTGNNCAPQTSLFKPPTPAPSLTSPSLTHSAITPAEHEPITGQRRGGSQMISRATNRGYNTVHLTFWLAHLTSTSSPLIGWLFIDVYISDGALPSARSVCRVFRGLRVLLLTAPLSRNHVA